MKTKLFFLGAFFLLTTTPFYAQKTKKIKKMEVKQVKVLKSPKVKVVPIKEKVVHGRIDPITGEEILPDTTPPPKEYDLSFTYPGSSDYYPHTSWSIMNAETLTVRGRAMGEHTLEIYMKHRGTVIKDWAPVYVQANGVWETQLNWGGTGTLYDTTLKILVRDAADKSEVKTMFLGQPDQPPLGASSGN